MIGIIRIRKADKKARKAVRKARAIKSTEYAKAITTGSSIKHEFYRGGIVR